MFGQRGPIWDWTRNEQAAKTILKDRATSNKVPKGAGSLEKKIVNTLLLVSILTALAYIIFNSF